MDRITGSRRDRGCVRATCLGAAGLGLRPALLEGGQSNWAADAASKIGAAEAELAKE